MRYMFWILSFALLLFLLTFAVKNSDPVLVRYFLGYEWRPPLIFLLLLFFGMGAVLGVLAALTKILRQRRQIAALKRELGVEPSAYKAPSPPDPVAT